MPRTLTEPFIRSLPPAPAGKRVAISDALVPGLRVRVTDRGAKSFILWKRYGNAKHPAARSLGAVGELSLIEARPKAREWIAALARGEEPRDASNDANTFGVVLEKFIEGHVAGQRQAAGVERLLRKELSGWHNRPLAKITKADVIAIVDEVTNRDAKYQAMALLRQIKVLFGWCVERGHLEMSPADRLKASRLIGKASARQRVLDNTELAAFWRAARRMPYPTGPLLQMLLLTGQRRSEVAEARWSEFNLSDRTWTVPAARHKSDAPHIVPLTDDMLAVLETLPRWKGGDFLFSTTLGRKAVNGWTQAKSQLDARMLCSLKALARKRGDDPSKVQLEPFVLHDLRRTVRTRLSALRVDEAVAEVCIGHGKKGLARVYNQHRYLDEVREAFDKWTGLLGGIVEPKTNVIPMRRKQ
jgi:integrase